jgi:Flp pilus assembly pilin Flp
MLRKISTFPLAAYLAVAGALRALNEDERGLSGVVVAILLILVAVLAIILIWGFLSGWLQDLWEQITRQADTIS